MGVKGCKYWEEENCSHDTWGSNAPLCACGEVGDEGDCTDCGTCLCINCLPNHCCCVQEED